MPDVTPVKMCNYNEALAWANSASGKNYLVSRNYRIAKLFPLTEYYLRSFYASNSFSGYKKSFPDVNCASDTISLLVATYGFKPGGSNESGAEQAQSSGLNPVFGVPLDLGFDFGAKTFNFLWILIALGTLIYLNKKK